MTVGMYDCVRIDDSIHLPEYELRSNDDVEWQTKTFERIMGTYKVTAEGKLFKEEWHYEEVPEEERPMYDEDIGGFENDLDKAFGSMAKVHEGWIQKDYHGRMNIVGTDEENFYEYSLKFTNGRLEDIELNDKHERKQ